MNPIKLPLLEFIRCAADISGYNDEDYDDDDDVGSAKKKKKEKKTEKLASFEEKPERILSEFSRLLN